MAIHFFEWHEHHSTYITIHILMPDSLQMGSGINGKEKSGGKSILAPVMRSGSAVRFLRASFLGVKRPV